MKDMRTLTGNRRKRLTRPNDVPGAAAKHSVC